MKVSSLINKKSFIELNEKDQIDILSNLNEKKYRLSQIDGVPQSANKPELVFGNIIHKVLQRFHEPNKNLTKERILNILDEEWKKDEFEYSVREQKFKEQGVELLMPQADIGSKSKKISKLECLKAVVFFRPFHHFNFQFKLVA